MKRRPNRFAHEFPSARWMAVLAACIGLLAPAFTRAAQEAGKNPKRDQALALYREHKQLEALPLLEELAAANPSDGQVQEGLGVCLLTHAATVTEPERRRDEVKRSRAALAKAQELGDSAEIVRILLQMLPESGDLPSFSGHMDADSAMREGEAAFARRDFDAAIEAYKRAMLLDATLYEAPLFVGDCYFNKKDFENAESWFAVAVSVNGDKETAYRYWGDALLSEKKVEQAHTKYIEAVIANPYSNATWAGLGHWARAAGRKLTQPSVEPRGKIADGSDSKHVTITIDPAAVAANDGSSAWTMYGITRAAWREKFQKQFPNEKTYRHSLAEESEALGLVVSSAREWKEKNPGTLNPGLAILVELSDRGLLEAYILLSQADQGIAEDYPAYRAGHRAELRQYLTDFVGAEKLEN